MVDIYGVQYPPSRYPISLVDANKMKDKYHKNASGLTETRGMSYRYEPLFSLKKGKNFIYFFE